MQRDEKPSLSIPPTSIDILGKKFKVHLMSDEEQDELAADGQMHLASQIISIKLREADDYNHDTMVHEIVHAIDEILRLHLKENQVHQLAAGLIAVLKQNKKLTDWLLNDNSSK